MSSQTEPIISPSILAADFANLESQIRLMEQGGAQYLHIDVMDGHFVPNISIGVPVVKSIRPKTKLVLDVHLMISRPLDYVEAFAKAGADFITFHLESDSDVKETMDAVRQKGLRCGISLKPKTPAAAVFPYLSLLDMVLIMTVEPGFGGQSFMADMLPKISDLRQEIAKQGLPTDIQVDGGIDLHTAPLVAAVGANVLVAGTALFGAENPVAEVGKLKQAFLEGLR